VKVWAKHYQSSWQERAANPRLPLWLRVSALAYGNHKANGHANYRPGEVALVLSTVDPATGVITTPDRRDVHAAVRLAVSNGWLAQGSGTTCLVVPAHAVSGGVGNAQALCPVHEKQRASRARRCRVRCERRV
jgi:hypothetical protein